MIPGVLGIRGVNIKGEWEPVAKSSALGVNLEFGETEAAIIGEQPEISTVTVSNSLILGEFWEISHSQNWVVETPSE